MPTSASIQWENAARVIEPGVTASGIHVCPLDPKFPMDVRFLRLRRPASVALRRHDYFELLYMKSGSAVYRVQDRDVVVNQGDLFVMGSHLFHGIQQYLTPSVRAVVLYFNHCCPKQGTTDATRIENVGLGSREWRLRG